MNTPNLTNHAINFSLHRERKDTNPKKRCRASKIPIAFHVVVDETPFEGEKGDYIVLEPIKREFKGTSITIGYERLIMASSAFEEQWERIK